MKPFCFANDRIVPSEQAVIHPLDIGLIRGYAIFDFFRTENFKPFFLEEYLHRFISSAEKTYLPLNLGLNELERVVHELIEKNELEQGGIRMILSGGVSGNHFSPSQGSLFIFCETLNMPPQAKYDLGVKLLSEEYVRPLPTIKSTNYTLPVRRSVNWKEQGIEDLIYHHQGIISESSRSNIFIVKDNKIATPIANILFGITRRNVIALSDGVEERDISLEELMGADEAFITSTTKRILPVTNIDGKPIGDGKVGEITRSLMEKFRELEKVKMFA